MARSLNGTSDFIDAGRNSVLTITTQISFAAWVFPTSTPASGVQATILCFGATSTGRNFDFDYRNNAGTLQLLASWSNSNSFATPSTNQTLTLNTWAHVGFTVDYTANPYVGQWYLNGSAVTTTNGGITSGTPDNPDSGQDVIIGALSANTKSEFWAGRLADIGLWKGIVLSAGEMLGLARGQRPYLVRPASFAAYWPLDGLQSPEPDLSGNVNNGTLTGTASAAGPPTTLFTSRWPQRAAEAVVVVVPELQNFNAFMGRRVAVIGY